MATKKKIEEQEEKEVQSKNRNRPKLTQEILESYLSNQDDHIKLMARSLLLIYGDLSAKLHLSLYKTINKVAEDLDGYADSDDGIFTHDKDDKTFDRLNTIMTKMDDYRTNILEGQKEWVRLGLIDKKDDNDTDFFEKQARARS